MVTLRQEREYTVQLFASAGVETPPQVMQNFLASLIKDPALCLLTNKINAKRTSRVQAEKDKQKGLQNVHIGKSRVLGKYCIYEGMCTRLEGPMFCRGGTPKYLVSTLTK